MTDDPNPSGIRVTDRRHFDRSGEKIRDSEGAVDPAPAGQAVPPQAAGPAAGRPSRQGAVDAKPNDRPAGRTQAPERTDPPQNVKERDESPIPENLADLAAGLSSSFSLLVARLAQETEIYLGLVPYPGKETREPDLEAARAMIDVLSMLEEKTRGNLDHEESRLLASLLYAYRLEFVRRKSGGEAR